MYCLLITRVLLLISFRNFVIGEYGQLRSDLRFTKVYNCNTTGLKWYLQNVTFYSQYPRIYLNAVQNVTGEIKKLNKMHMRIERCNDEGFNCEDFQNWDVPNFCPMLNWKNQIWSEFIDSIHPPLRCPLKKMIYEIRNATIDVNSVLRWYPECAKYRWRAVNIYFDEHDTIVFCGIFEAHIYQYMKRTRKYIIVNALPLGVKIMKWEITTNTNDNVASINIKNELGVTAISVALLVKNHARIISVRAGNMSHLFFICLTLSILIWNLAICQNGLRSEIRFTKAANCNITGLKWYLANITIYSQYPRTYLSAIYNITNDIKKLNKMNLKIERCNNEGYNCEDFQNWDIANFCPMLTWKNQVWSEFIDSIHPKLRCPLKKMEYEIRNATIDLDALLRWYPEFVKYRWKVENKYFDDHNDMIFCGIFEAHVYQYMKRNRIKPRY